MNTDRHALASLPNSSSHWLHSYPAHLSRTWTLTSGESLSVRAIRHDDGELEEAFVRALSFESRYQRMLSGGTKVTPEWIDSMTHIDYHRHMAFAVITVIDAVEQFVGVGRYVVEAATLNADIALVLADAWQGQGLGHRLLETLLEHATSAGIRQAAGIVLAANVAMLRLARSMGFTVNLVPGDATVRRISRELTTVRTTVRGTVSAQQH
ncbi:MAG TPA: GNAT family N-acetyltransferase [Casimicrobiaceae bacterium]|jgi:acetyltransferase|nr:GNAT family N-acetyltransferase [Casimicrobiaceae bacterium]